MEQIQKDQEQEVAARKEQEVAAGEQQVVEAGEEQAVYAMQEQNVEGGDEQVGEEGEKQVGEGGEEPVQVEEKPLIEDGEEKVGDVDQEQVVEGGEEQEDAEVPSKAIETETETETETVAVDDTPSAEEIAAATKLQRVARGSQVRPCPRLSDPKFASWCYLLQVANNLESPSYPHTLVLIQTHLMSIGEGPRGRVACGASPSVVG